MWTRTISHPLLRIQIVQITCLFPNVSVSEARYLSDVGRDAIARHRAALLAAADALDAILAPAQCPQLVQAIIQVRAGG